MDFIVSRPQTQRGHGSIKVIVDRLITKLANFIPTKTIEKAHEFGVPICL